MKIRSQSNYGGRKIKNQNFIIKKNNVNSIIPHADKNSFIKSERANISMKIKKKRPETAFASNQNKFILKKSAIQKKKAIKENLLTTKLRKMELIYNQGIKNVEKRNFESKKNMKNSLNGKKMKKYLYVKDNELKKSFYNFYYKNIKLETKIKHLETNIDKYEKKLNEYKKNSNPKRNYDKLDQRNKIHLIEAFENKNPNILKKKIREQKVIIENLNEELEDLKIKTKGDNLLVLSNETVFQNKLLLNSQENIKNLENELISKYPERKKVMKKKQKRLKELNFLLDCLKKDILEKNNYLNKLKEDFEEDNVEEVKNNLDSKEKNENKKKTKRKFFDKKLSEKKLKNDNKKILDEIKKLRTFLSGKKKQKSIFLKEKRSLENKNNLKIIKEKLNNLSIRNLEINILINNIKKSNFLNYIKKNFENKNSEFYDNLKKKPFLLKNSSICDLKNVINNSENLIEFIEEFLNRKIIDNEILFESIDIENVLGKFCVDYEKYNFKVVKGENRIKKFLFKKMGFDEKEIRIFNFFLFQKYEDFKLFEINEEFYNEFIEDSNSEIQFINYDEEKEKNSGNNQKEKIKEKLNTFHKIKNEDINKIINKNEKIPNLLDKKEDLKKLNEKRKKKDEKEEMGNVATKIQSVFRGKKGRKLAEKEKQEKLKKKHEKELENAAVKIQSIYRGKKDRKKIINEKKTLNKEKLKKKKELELKEKKEKEMNEQKDKELKEKKEKELKEQKEKELIEKKLRKEKKEKELKEKKEKELKEKKLKEEIDSIVKIQKRYRGNKDRKRFLKLKLEKKEQEENTINKLNSEEIIPKKDNNELLNIQDDKEMIKASIKIQKIYRGKKDRKKLNELKKIQKQKENEAIKIQKNFRAKRDRKKFIKIKENKTNSALHIQRHYRGKRDRKKFKRKMKIKKGIEKLFKIYIGFKNKSFNNFIEGLKNYKLKRVFENLDRIFLGYNFKILKIQMTDNDIIVNNYLKKIQKNIIDEISKENDKKDLKVIEKKIVIKEENDKKPDLNLKTKNLKPKLKLKEEKEKIDKINIDLINNYLLRDITKALTEKITRSVLKKSKNKDTKEIKKRNSETKKEIIFSDVSKIIFRDIKKKSLIKIDQMKNKKNNKFKNFERFRDQLNKIDNKKEKIIDDFELNDIIKKFSLNIYDRVKDKINSKNLQSKSTINFSRNILKNIQNKKLKRMQRISKLGLKSEKFRGSLQLNFNIKNFKKFKNYENYTLEIFNNKKKITVLNFCQIEENNFYWMRDFYLFHTKLKFFIRKKNENEISNNYFIKIDKVLCKYDSSTLMKFKLLSENIDLKVKYDFVINGKKRI